MDARAAAAAAVACAAVAAACAAGTTAAAAGTAAAATAAASTAAAATGAGAAEDGSSPRHCRRCGASKAREHFTPKQWSRADPAKRTCSPCCTALDLERIAREKAEGTEPKPRAWSGRHNKPSRGKAPRHAQGAAKQPIVVAENIDDYRAAIAEHVRPTDIVLEIGCHQGASTVLLDNAGARCVGVDKGQHVLSEGRRLHPHIAFHDIDAADVSALTKLNAAEGPFDVVFIDIGGGSLKSVSSVWSLIEAYGASSMKSARVFVVKSFKLAELMQRCVAVHDGASTA